LLKRIILVIVSSASLGGGLSLVGLFQPAVDWLPDIFEGAVVGVVVGLFFYLILPDLKRCRQ